MSNNRRKNTDEFLQGGRSDVLPHVRTKELKKMRDSMKGKSKNNNVEYASTKAMKQFNKDWDAYFGNYNKREAGVRWARNKKFDLLDVTTPIEQRVYLLNWFKDMLRPMKKHSCWVLECGIFYVIDKTAMKAYYFSPHISITRRVRTLNEAAWTNRLEALVRQELNEKIEWSRGGHTTYFHAGNLFFLNQLGYEVIPLDIAPGWWSNSGVSKQMHRMASQQGKTLDDVIESGDVSKVLGPINEYRENEITRIATRVWDVMNGKYPGEKIYDAILYEDADGIKYGMQ